jgi:hypothetical protein
VRGLALLVECIEYIALMFLCCITVKSGHWIVAIFMLLIGSSFLFGIRVER